MNKELIDRAATSYADSIPQFDDRKRYCREDFIAGVEWLAAYLCKIPFDEIITELGDWAREKKAAKISHDLPENKS